VREGFYMTSFTAVFSKLVKIVASLCVLIGMNIGFVYAAPPSFSASFSPGTVGPGNVSTLTFTITDVGSTGARNVSFTNVLPAGLVHATSSGAVTTCSNGTLSAPDGGDTLTFSGYDVAADTSCTVFVDILSSTTAGTYTVLTGDLTSDQGNSLTATSGLIVATDRPGYSMSFSPTSINQGAVSTLSVTVDNSLNGSLISNLSSTISLPVGLVIADDANSSVSASCGGLSLNTSSGSSVVTVGVDGLVAAGAVCTFNFDVKATGIGELAASTSTLTVFSSSTLNSGSAKTVLTSSQAFALLSFAENPTTPGATTTLDITLTNFDRSNSATNISFTDDLDAALSGLTATSLPTEPCGAGSSITGVSNLTFTGGMLAPEASCSFSVGVLIPANAIVSSNTNTTSTFSYDLGGSPTVKPAVSHNLTISQAPTIELSVAPNPVVAGNELTASFTVTNIDVTNPVTDISFVSDIHDFAPSLATFTFPADPCGVGSAVASIMVGVSTDRQAISLTGGSLAIGGTMGDSCTFDVGITIPNSASAGSHTMVTDPITATILASSVTGTSAASGLFEIITAPSLNITFDNTEVLPGGTLNSTFTLTNSASSPDATSTAFTVNLDAALAGMAATSFPSNTCAGSSLSGTSTIDFSAGTLTSGSSCSFTAVLQLPGGGASTNVDVISSDVSAMVSGNVVSSPAVTSSFDVVTLAASVVVTDNDGDADNNIQPGSTTATLDFSLSNLSAVDNTGITFTMNLSAALAGMSSSSGTLNDICGTGSAISGTTFLIFTGGNLTAGTNCNFSVTLSVPGGAADGSYSVVSSNVTSSASVAIAPMTSSFIIETDLPPSIVSITSSVSPLTGVAPIPMDIIFSEDIEGFVDTDISVTNGTASNLVQVSADHYTFDIIMPSDGTTIDVELLAGVVEELGVGTQTNTASSVFSIDYDTTALPSASISVTAGQMVNTGPVTASVTYSNATDINLTSDKVNLNLTGTASTLNFVDNDTANPDISVINGTSSTPTIVISNLIGDGTIGIGLDIQTARNDVGDVQAVSDSVNTFSVDNTLPTVVISSGVSDPTNMPFTANFDFDDPVTGFDSSDVILSNANISGFTGSGTAYSATISPIANGNVTIDINAGVAQDDHGNGNTAATQFSVTNDISAPTGYAVAISTPQTFINASNDTAFQFNYSGAEIGADYSYTITDGVSTSTPATGTIATVSGSFSGIDVSSFNEGTLTLSFELTDIAGNTGTPSTDTIIKQYNDAPVITEGATISVTMSEDETPTAFALTLNASDPESEAISWSILSNASNGTASASGTGNSKVVNYSPNTDFNGMDSFVVEITDNNALDPLTDSITVNVTIDPTNDLPTIDSTEVTLVNEDANYSYTFSASDIDVGDMLTLSAPVSPLWLNFNSGTGLLSGIPTNDDVGTHNVTLRVNDGTADVDQSFVVTVVNTNDAPTIDSVAVTSVDEDALYSYTFSASDVDVGDSLTYSAPVLPSWLSFVTGSGVLEGTPTNSEVGVHNVTLRVNDGTVDIDQSFVITVANTNDAPIIDSIAVTSTNEDALYTYTMSASDVDAGDSLTLSAPVIPSWLSFVPATGILSGTPTNDEVGTHNITLRVNDGTINIDQSFTLSVLNTNDAPTIDSIAVTSVDEDALYSYTFAASDVDVGDSLTYSAPVLPSWLSFAASTGVLSGTPSNDEVGSHNVTLRANDGTVNSDQSFVIDVINTNDSPTGLPLVTGNLIRTENLGVDTSPIADVDGLGTYSYQWRRTGVNLIGETASTYLLVENDIGQTISVIVSYTDGGGTLESVTSVETGVIADLDSDGDGIGDLEEGTGDSDGDGIPDYLDEDSDNDGIPDSEEGNGDSDGDGIADYLDTSLDEDGDGVPDSLESNGGVDTDGDGIADAFDNDSDNDGVSDFDESGASGIDTDGDGIDDTFDVDQTGGIDADNDGIDDDISLTDTDQDGVPDYIDRDSDGDSVPDALENDQGMLAMQSVQTKAILTLLDRDNDGLINSIDLDSDGDGVSDFSEAATTSVDSDLDQIIDEFDVDFTGGLDVDLDGVDDAAVLQNSDNDLVPDMFDLDSDNDSLVDVLEAGLVDDDLNALLDDGESITETPRDSDSDGLADHLDLDSNDDGTFDIEVTEAASLDIDGDGQIDDASVDADNDGIIDAIDNDPTQFGTGIDHDKDGLSNRLDLDDDGDGISDLVEGNLDTDNDGLIDSQDIDSDGDGLSDMFEADRPAALGQDIDQDGIDDQFDVDFTGGADVDSDGVDDIYSVVDTDQDGTPDYLDLDSDNDNISDAGEQLLVILSGLDSDNDGLDDTVDVDSTSGVDSNGDGLDDATISNDDLDGDGVLAYRDSDTDGDGIADIDENGDFNNDGINDRLQVEVEVTATSGGGSLSILLAMMLLLLIAQRSRSLVARSFKAPMSKLALIAACLFTFSSQATESCGSENEMCWYTEIGMGQSQFEPVVSVSGWEIQDDTDLAGKLILGAEISENWFAEIGYALLGNVKLTHANPTFVYPGNIRYKALEGAVGYQFSPQDSSFGFRVKIGFVGLDTSSNFIADDSEDLLLLGATVSWEVADNQNLVIGYDSYGDDIELISIGIRTRF